MLVAPLTSSRTFDGRDVCIGCRREFGSLGRARGAAMTGRHWVLDSRLRMVWRRPIEPIPGSCDVGEQRGEFIIFWHTGDPLVFLGQLSQDERPCSLAIWERPSRNTECEDREGCRGGSNETARHCRCDEARSRCHRARGKYGRFRRPSLPSHWPNQIAGGTENPPAFDRCTRMRSHLPSQLRTRLLATKPREGDGSRELRAPVLQRTRHDHPPSSNGVGPRLRRFISGVLTTQMLRTAPS